MNRQQNRTRKAIFNAFTELLSKKNYNKITVQEIIDLADIGRSTFYSHFETKDDLLKEISRELFEHIFSKDLNHQCNLKYENTKDPNVVISHILYHIKENKKTIVGVLTCESSEIFIKYFKENVGKLINSFIHIDNDDIIYSEFLQNHIITTFVETINWWIKNDMKQSSEEIAKFYLSVIMPII